MDIDGSLVVVVPIESRFWASPRDGQKSGENLSSKVNSNEKNLPLM